MPINLLVKSAVQMDINQIRMSRRNIEKRRAFFADLAIKTNTPQRYYMDAIDNIGPGIIPLVLALDTPLTTPIFSCQGHWSKRSEPYVMFAVLPGKEWEFQRFVTNLVKIAPVQYTGMRFEQRAVPRGPNAMPFTDWTLTLYTPFERIRSPKSFKIRTQYIIGRYALFLIEEMRKWKSGKCRKTRNVARCGL